MRERIICLAIELFDKNGVKAVTMEEIATRLSISKRTLYEHFGGKDALLAECLHIRMTDSGLLALDGGNLIDELLGLYRSMRTAVSGKAYRFCQELRRYHTPVYEGLLNEMSGYAELCSRKVLPGIGDGLIRREIRENEVYAAVEGALIRFFSDEVSGGQNFRKALSPEIIVIFTRGLCTIKGRAYLDNKLKEISL